MIRAEASAPSNIALIKYMGKTSATTNVPTNSSLSYSLEHLRSFVVLEERDAAEDTWQPLIGFNKIQLSENGKAKFLKFFARLKQAWNIEGSHVIKSANNFPSDCGLASSASSFAALTLATYNLAQKVRPDFELSRAELSRQSRLGSGSSCRSLFSPWALWRHEGAEALNIKLQLEHAVIIVGEERKEVSSSEAHVRVQSSLLFKGRPERAEQRLIELISSLKSEAGAGVGAGAAAGAAAGAWAKSFELMWSEFWDMHALFETSWPGFGYMSSASLEVLRQLKDVWITEGDGPLVTMDAGANIHMLIRSDQISKADKWIADWNCLKSWS